jgi:outer membrane biosynthesis protein TonB
MHQPNHRFPLFSLAKTPAQAMNFLACGVLAVVFSLALHAQEPPAAQQQVAAPPPQASDPAAPGAPAADQPAQTQAPTPAPADTQPAAPPSQSTPAVPAEAGPSSTPQQPSAAAPADAEAPSTPSQPSASAAGGTSQTAQPGEISEDQLRKLLIGKQLFLRGGYLDNSLSYNEHGVLIGRSAQGSYTLNGIEIDRVRLTRHKVELEGERYGLHFLGSLPYEDPTKAVDRVNITPKKKEIRITIDRELVVKPKQEKGKGWFAKNAPAPPAKSAPAAPDSAATTSAPSPASEAAPGTAPAAAPASTQTAPAAENPDAEAQAEIAAAPPAERPADPNSVTTTLSAAHANKVLTDALDNIFAQGFDDRMMAAMPGFWKFYYDAAAAKTDYRPKDPTVLRQNMVDQKARLLSTFEPSSNQYAQDKGVAGMSLYHVVIEPDGKPGEIAVARPIGFGLDESAVDSIRKASFAPAMKDGKPVPVLLDLVVEFRIYSKRTNVASAPETADEKNAPALPGPYSVQHTQSQ